MKVLAPLLAAIAAACRRRRPRRRPGVYTVYACDAAGTPWDNRSWALDRERRRHRRRPGLRRATTTSGSTRPPGARTADGDARVAAVPRPGGHRHRRLPPDQADHLPQPDAGRHAPLLRDHRARRHRDRGRGQLPRRHARQAPRPGPLVRLSGGQRRHRHRDRLEGLLPRAGGLRRRRAQPHRAHRLHQRAARRAAPPAAPTSPTTSAAPRSTSTTRPRPRDLTVDASGLLRGGDVAGSDPVRVKVSDASGIRRVEIIDVTGTPAVVGRRGLRPAASRPTAARAARSASPRRARSSPTARRCARRRCRPAAASCSSAPSTPAATRSTAAPTRLNVVSPSDRGALNGGDATEGGRVSVRFTTRHTPDAAHDRLPLQGADRRPAAQRRRPADRRRPRRGAHPRPRRRRREAAHLRHHRRRRAASSYTATAYASRLYQFAWASHVNDARYAANGYVTLLARASATLKSEPAHRVASASGSSSTAGSPASARGAASTSSPRAARARAGAGARSPTARSAARALSASPTASRTRPRAGARSSSGSRSSATAATPTGAATRAPRG